MQTQVKDPKESTVSIVIDLNVEEMEEVIAPQGIVVNSPFRNHNETLVSDEVELSFEELEEVIAPAFTSFLSFGDIKGDTTDRDYK